MGSKLYFETYFDMDSLVLHSGSDLDYYLQFNQSNEVIQYVNCMKFMQYFLSGNKELCNAEYEKSLNLRFPEGNLSTASSRFIPQIIYPSVFGTSLDKNILEEVYGISDRLLQTGIQNRIGPPYFEYEIIFALNYGKMNKEIITLAHNIFKNYDLAGLKSSCFYQLFLSIYALALLETGKAKKAIELYDHVKFKNTLFPEHMKYYMQLRLLLIKTEFLIYKGNTEKARQKLRKIKKIAKLLNFNFFYNKAIEIEQCILAKYKIQE
jgi:tetratricopeptide (TPR) repeat protein